MNSFARGARVRPPKPLDQKLTMIEASFVMCSVAERDGFCDEEAFIQYMRRAWCNYRLAGVAETQFGDSNG